MKTLNPPLVYTIEPNDRSPEWTYPQLRNKAHQPSLQTNSDIWLPQPDAQKHKQTPKPPLNDFPYNVAANEKALEPLHNEHLEATYTFGILRSGTGSKSCAE